MSDFPKALLLDLDDTIIAYSAGADTCWENACRIHGGRYEGRTCEEVYASICCVRDWYWGDPVRNQRGRLDMLTARTEIVAMAFQNLGFDAPDLARTIAAMYAASRDEQMGLFPGALKALDHFRQSGSRMALITNGRKEVQWGKIRRFSLESFFDCILVEGEFGIGKPDPRIFQEALRRLDAEPQNAWMVGDNMVWDVEGAQRVGIKGIWMDFERKGLPPKRQVEPDRVVCSLAELAGVDSFS